MDEGTPETLMEAIQHFALPDVAHNFLVQLRWANGVKCPRCKSDKVCAIATRKTWECKSCITQKQFSVKTGTIFEESPLPLPKWMATIWMIANAKNGISSYEVHRSIGVTQKTAWFMLSRIRLAMQSGSFEKLGGEIEVDETYIGGKARFMHKQKKLERIKGTGDLKKSVVVGILQRNGHVRAIHIPTNSRVILEEKVRQHVEPGSEVFTDALPSYDKLRPDFAHQFIDHAETYVEGKIHTNGLENFWSLLKRCIKGTYVSIEPAHLFRYLDEQVFRFNNREDNDASRFLMVLKMAVGRRLTYSELTGKTDVTPRPG